MTVRTPWGKSREVRLIERRGSHAMGETVDEGPKNLMLVQRQMVIPADVSRFDAWFNAFETK